MLYFCAYRLSFALNPFLVWTSSFFFPAFYSSALANEKFLLWNKAKATLCLFMSCLYLSVQVLFCFFGQSLNYDHVSLFTLLKESHSLPSITLFLLQWSGKSSWVKPSQEKIYIYLLWFGTLTILINYFQHINNRNTMSQRRREEEGSGLFRYLPHISAWCWSYIVIDIKCKRSIFRWYEFNKTQSSLKPWFLSPPAYHLMCLLLYTLVDTCTFLQVKVFYNHQNFEIFQQGLYKMFGSKQAPLAF